MNFRNKRRQEWFDNLSPQEKYIRCCIYNSKHKLFFAKAQLKNNFQNIDTGLYPELSKTFNHSINFFKKEIKNIKFEISILKKQLKQPVLYNRGLRCPRCHEVLVYENLYCGTCGQKLDFTWRVEK